MFMHTCARNTMYTCILKLTSQIYLIFDSLISLNFSSKFKFFRFADMLTKTDYRCARYDFNFQTDWNLAISLKQLKHCSHDWETNKTLSTWYSVKWESAITDHCGPSPDQV